MWEDQTIGNPELAYLYYKGYSKDYVKQYLDKYVPYDERNKYSDDEYSTGFFVKEEFHRGGNDYIDALYDNGSQDQEQNSENIDPKEEKKAAEEAKKINDGFHGNHEQLSEAVRTLYDDKKFDEVYKNVGNTIKEKFKDDFDELEKTYGGFDEVENEYLALAGLNRALMEDGGKMEDISYMPRLYLYDDLNQGDLTAEAIWAYDNGINDSWDKWDHMNEIEKNAKNDMANEFVNNKSYESKIIKNLDDYIKDSIKSHIWNNEVVPDSYWTLYNAGDTSKSEYDSVKDTTLKEAREISKKLSSSCGSDASGWALLNKAVNNLNLGGKDYTELTQADWDRINAEINSLKR